MKSLGKMLSELLWFGGKSPILMSKEILQKSMQDAENPNYEPIDTEGDNEEQEELEK